MSRIAERSRQAGLENERRVLGVLAAAGDVGLEPGVTVARAAMPAQTYRGVIARLESRGLVRREGKRRVFATQAGIIEAGAGVPGVDLVPALDAAIAHFPTEAHRAFVRLLLSGIVVRHHLHAHYGSDWPGFIAVGGTGSGKTAMATLTAVIFGVRPESAIRMLRRETPGSVFARRTQRGGAWKVERSSLMDLPFLALDEWDKAPEQVRQESGSLLLGSTRPDLEGEDVEVRPLVMVMLNVQPTRLGDVLHEAFVRRSVVLYTTPLKGQLTDLDDAMHRLFDGRSIPRVQLDRVKPSVTALPEQERAAMRKELRTALTDEGWRLCDVEGVSRLALGRAALIGDGDVRRAALATALDYLYTAATIDHVRPGFDGHLAAQLGRGLLLPDVESARSEARQRVQVEKRERAAVVAADLASEHERERRAAELVTLRQAMGRPPDPEGKAIGKALAKAAAQIRGCRGWEALEAVWTAVQPYLDAARRRVAQRNREHQAEEHRKQREADRIRWAREHKTAERDRRKSELKRWMETRRRLSAMMPLKCTQFKDPDAKLAAALKELRVGWPATWAARRGWDEAWRHANRQVVELGGRAGKQPAYRVVNVKDEFQAGIEVLTKSCAQVARALDPTQSRRRPSRQSTR